MANLEWYQQIGALFCYVLPLILLGGWLGWKVLLLVFWINSLLVTRKIPWKKQETK